jgi:AraC family transcriptional regulator
VPAADSDRQSPVFEWASSVILLLQSATREVGGDGEAAKTFIARTCSLIQVEADRSVFSSRDTGAGALGPWQEWGVTAFIDEQLTGQIHVEDLSRLLNPSKSYFTRALGRSFGEAPHGCGVLDQAHFCRLFRLATGESPAA